MSNKKILLTLLLLAIATPSLAITWHKPTNVIETKTSSSSLEFGDIKVIMDVTYSTSPLIKPEYIVSMYKGEELLAKLPGVGVQVLTASANNSVFVGLSNTTMPGTAFIILNNKGELLREVKHISVALDYCIKNDGLNKAVWFDPKRPNIQFKYAPDGVSVIDISILDCKGEQVSLPEVVLKAYDNMVKEVEYQKQQR
ncbi:MAG: hypothetical protein L3J28_06730 [Candidatus Polarisedimenticolaceae bacterium]|nr:hypothetical protein [Candidatus Polarisedimenticolaceae bacterium]